MLRGASCLVFHIDQIENSCTAAVLRSEIAKIGFSSNLAGSRLSANDSERRKERTSRLGSLFALELNRLPPGWLGSTMQHTAGVQQPRSGFTS
ncbi:hypothetical protein RRG08_037081 [Elysia crispata]|uniref:Uncharacterized protein n=1 Tax=Elysia crispata TaxID=231223 RepID=A0AAE0ZW98_9GAST|nr:hypothetical protein RRG08_037081 [Elysia crispata]